jgi:hypothetical protein
MAEVSCAPAVVLELYCWEDILGVFVCELEVVGKVVCVGGLEGVSGVEIGGGQDYFEAAAVGKLGWGHVRRAGIGVIDRALWLD